jgi:capsular exopolysaccharide synthesis family protein
MTSTMLARRGTGPKLRGRAASLRRRVLSDSDELFRGLYTRSNVRWRDVLAITSSVSGEGRTTVSLGIATTMAQDFPDRRVLVVETDLSRPAFATDFRIDQSPGLAECIGAGRVLAQSIQPTSLRNLWLMPAGDVTARSERLLGSPRLKGVLDELRSGFDLVVLDAPPVISSADGGPVAALADGVILVVRIGSTRVDQTERALARIAPEALRGVVLNGADSSVPRWLQRVFRLGGPA